MPTVQVDKAHPVLVSLQSAKKDVVENIGNVVLYYKAGPAGAAVSASEKDGELAEAATLTMEQSTWFVAKEATGTLLQKPATLEEVPSTEIADGAVTASKLGSEAVTASKIGKEAVSEPKAKAATTPAAGAEKSVTLGTAGVQRKITAVHVGDGAETKVKVKHSFETQAVNVVVQKGAETKKAGANYLNAAGAGNFTWEPISASEVEVTFGTAPIAKFESFLSVYA